MRTVLEKRELAEAGPRVHEPVGSAVPWARAGSFRGNFTSPALVTHRPCPVCTSIRSRVVLVFSGFQFFTDSIEVPKRVDINECQCLDCFALYINPCYTDYGFRVLFREAGCSYGASDGREEEKFEWLSKRGLLKSGMRVLDVGCYDGGFLASLPKDVIKVGVDIDAPAVERGRAVHESSNIEFILGDFETFRFDGAPDVVTMYHVLEHLPRPVSVLQNLRAAAHGLSKLVVEVPILEDGATNDINGFLSAQHMTHFSRRSLENTLLSAGWHITERSQQQGYNGYRVVAEPGEPVLTARGEQKDMALFHRYLSSWYGALTDAAAALERFGETRRCVIWGGGLHTEFIYHTTPFFHSGGEREYVIVDNDPIKRGATWRGIPVCGPSVLSGMDWSEASLLISSYGSQEAIREEARKLGVPEDRIITLYKELRVY